MTTPTLYLVATPIGNLEDISLRALRVLREVDLIACEDTRRTIKLLNHYGIHVPRESHHRHNEAESTARLITRLKEGARIALVSDAGTPSISDPGRMLVSACRREGLRVEAIPGPSAAIAALAGSGLRADSFFFAGFLPSRRGQRRDRLEELASIQATLILYEAPHRLEAALEDILGLLGPRRACLARELTKVHEEWLTGRLDEILASVRSRTRIQGEITLVIDRGEPADGPIAPPPSLARHLEEEMRRTGASRKEALKSVARQRGVSRKEAYRQLLAEKG
jgi:16S rRNA (cytidine1402-2'-O)-methyltransferase